jgi:hypothetical protein
MTVLLSSRSIIATMMMPRNTMMWTIWAWGTPKTRPLTLETCQGPVRRVALQMTSDVHFQHQYYLHRYYYRHCYHQTMLKGSCAVLADVAEGEGDVGCDGGAKCGYGYYC